MRIIVVHTIVFLISATTSHCMLDELKKDAHKFVDDMQHAKKDIGAVIGMIVPSANEFLNGIPKAITDNPHKDRDAFVRQGAGISQGEKEYLQKRLPIVKAALEKSLNRSLSDHQIPTIAVTCSGGGVRAQLCTTGFLRGLEKSGILDTITYLAGLSGSTWAIAPWISTKKSLKEFEIYIKECAEKPFLEPTDAEELLIFEAAAVKAHFSQTRTSVDPYAALLGNKFLKHFEKDRHTAYLSQQTDIIKDGSHPYPIYTAIDADEHIAENQDWYEFTPHEIGNLINNTYIPTWAFGRNFKDGKSHKDGHHYYPPEKNASYKLATFGSAFGADIKTIEHEIAKKIGKHEFIEKCLQPFESNRPLNCYAEVPNYAYKLACHSKNKHEHMCFVDAGTDFNLPIPPISGQNPERKADIIIICDASGGHIGSELKKAAAYMKKHELPFPEIDFTDIDKKTISIFKADDPHIPVVIYLPRISDKELWEQHKENQKYAQYNLSGFDLDHETNHGFATTIHFDYKPEDAQKVMDQAKFNVHVNQKAIIDAIRHGVERKK